MDDLTSVSKPDLLKMVGTMNKEIKVLQAEVLRIRKLIQNL